MQLIVKNITKGELTISQSLIYKFFGMRNYINQL